MKRYIKASWNGIFSPRFISQNSELNTEQAKEVSDYLYEHGYDSGFSSRQECVKWIERWEGGFDAIYEKYINKF
jgi:hypothetical protein